ncbi:MAG: alpha/beta hydrolase fold-domain-containing protein [Benniella sp.]|nr:MAG: alpha/beta hydrolase fold-domain-containing protein [Benniella sp.]
MTLSQNQTAIKYWGPIAYSRFILYTTALVLRHSVRHVFGRTPKGQTLVQGYLIQILKLVMGASVLNVAQARTMMNLSNNLIVHLKNGTFLQSSKDKWALKVKGKGWEGFWIPFRDQSSKEKQKADLKKKASPTDIGAGCDIVMFAIHGGGMVMGDALMFMGNYRAWMKELQLKHNIKIGVLSIEYTLSPEAPFPGALNECVAAYRHLVEHQGVDPRRIVMCGDSAGGNLCLATALKIRDDYPHILLPAGQVLFSPWVMCPKPLKDSPDDYITNRGGRLFMEAYTQSLAKHQTSHFCSPISAPSLSGMPRMLIFIGGVETLRPSIERFVEKAKAEGVDLEVHLKEGKAHDYALIRDIAGSQAVTEANQIIGRFVAGVRDQYLRLTA